MAFLQLADWLHRVPSFPKPRKRIPRVSPRKQSMQADYKAAVAAHLAEFPRCQIGPVLRAAGIKVRCLGRGTHCHHVRGRLGKLLCDRRYFKTSCNGECHPQFIHFTNPSKARDLGLLV